MYTTRGTWTTFWRTPLERSQGQNFIEEASSSCWVGKLWEASGHRILFTFLLTFHTVSIFLTPKLYLPMLKWQTLPPKTHWFHFTTLPFLGRVHGQRWPFIASSTFWSVVLNFLCTWGAFKNPDILALNQNHLEWGPDI